MIGKKGHIEFSKKLKEFLLALNKDGITRLSLKITGSSSTLGNVLNSKNKLTEELFLKILNFVFVELLNKSDLKSKEYILKLNIFLGAVKHSCLETKDIVKINSLLKEINNKFHTSLILTVHNKCYVVIPKENKLEIRDGVLTTNSKNKYLNEIFIIVKNLQEQFKEVELKNKVVVTKDIEFQADKNRFLKQYNVNFKDFKEKRANKTQNDLLVQQLTAFFIGREFLFEEVNNFIKTNQSGYFYLFGNPGIGKSAFAVNYSQSKESVLHIIRHSDNSKNKTRHFLKNVINQLQQKYDLPISNYPENYTDDGAFLYEVLEQVSSLLYEDKKIIIVIDGIDELEDLTFFRRKNILNLPSLLPTGIFFLITMRNIKKQIRLPYNNGETQEYILENDSKNNKEDIAKFLQLKVKDENIQTYLTKHGVKETDFVTDLERKSEGNFMYLTHVLREIENGFYQDTTLNQLPTGLEGYYRDHWERMMQDVSEIDKEIRLKVLYVLGTLKKPASARFLTDIINTDLKEAKQYQVQEVLDSWRQFLNQSETQFEELTKTYSIYHKSFLDFLSNKELVNSVGFDFNKAEDLHKDFLDGLIDGVFDDIDFDDINLEDS